MNKVGTVNKLETQSACCDMYEMFAEFPPFSPTTVHYMDVVWVHSVRDR